ncbi:MAG: hypothetical protein ACRELY_22035 [Polyangiaceae bacterium]
MIDEASGTLFFDDGTEVDPRILRPKFLASPLELPSEPDVKSVAPWSIYALAPRVLDGTRFASRLSFHEDSLRMLAIWDVEVAEDERLDRHDKWLMKTIGETSKIFPWGKVESKTEPDGSHVVLLSYL